MEGTEAIQEDARRAWSQQDTAAAARLVAFLARRRASASPELVAAACLGVAQVAWWAQQDPERARRYVDAGLARLDIDLATLVGLRLLNFSAFLASQQGRILEALPAVLSVRRLAPDVPGAERELLQAQYTLVAILTHLGALDEAEALHRELREEGGAFGPGETEHAILLLRRGDVDAAREVVARLRSTLEGGRPAAPKVLSVLDAWIALADGKLEDVLEKATYAVGVPPAWHQLEVVALWLRAEAHLALGDPVAAEADARKGLGHLRYPAGGLVHRDLTTVLVRALHGQGRHDDVIEEVAQRTSALGGAGERFAVGLLRMVRDFDRQLERLRYVEVEARAQALARVNRELEEARDTAEAALAAQRALQEHLQRAAKLEAVGQLSAGLAHDLNNFLTTVYGSADGLRLQLGEGGPAAPFLAELDTASERASRLSRRLLALTRRRTDPASTVAIHTVMERVAEQARERLGPEVTFALELGPPAVAHIAADAVVQALMNLVVNAQEAIEGEGRVTLRQELGLCPEGRPAIRVVVEDDGDGMSEAVRRRVFEPFFSTKDRKPGSGLGLTICQQVAVEAGGVVDVRSEPGRGCSVALVLPQVEGATRPRAPSDVDAPSPQPRSSGEVILLVEDEPLVRRSTARCLRRLGFEVWTAENGREGMERFDEGPERVTAVISDIVMPEASGVDVARYVVERHPRCPVLLMSGYAEEEALGDLLAHPRVRFLAKPFRYAELEECLAQVLVLARDHEAAG